MRKHKQKKLTGTEGTGSGEEGTSEQVPASSLSVDRKGEQVPAQACSTDRTTGPMKVKKNLGLASKGESDNSSDNSSLRIRRAEVLERGAARAHPKKPGK